MCAAVPDAIGKPPDAAGRSRAKNAEYLFLLSFHFFSITTRPEEDHTKL